MLIRKFLAAFACLAALLASLSVQASPLYTVTLLPGIDFAPTGMNNAGQIVGFAGTGAGGVQTVLYSDGVLHGLGTFGGASSYGNAINDAGAIAGTFLGASGEQHGFLYQDGRLTDIGAGTTGEGINARGDVVGSRQNEDGTHGYLYSDGALRDLSNVRTGKQGAAYDINDLGQAVGASTIDFRVPDPAVHAFLYRKGDTLDLGALGSNHITRAVAINNAGQIAGASEGADGARAFLIDGPGMTDLGGFGGDEMTVHDLNEHGRLVGTASSEEQGLIPFMNVGDALVDLNTLIDPTLGWQIFSAYANNDLDQIVGWGCQGETCGMVRLDLASSVPEPSAALLMLPGLLMLTGLWRHQSRNDQIPMQG